MSSFLDQIEPLKQAALEDLRSACMSSFLDQIEPLKQAALEDLRSAKDLSALEQAKITHLGAHGKFTALLKQLGSLSKEERPAAGKLINQAKVELEGVLAELRSALELKAPCPRSRLISRCRAGGVRRDTSTRSRRSPKISFASFANWASRSPMGRRSRMNTIALTR